MDSPVTREYLDKRFAEQDLKFDEKIDEVLHVVQAGFADIEARLGGRQDALETKIDVGFGKLDAFLGKMNRLDEAEAMNQAAHRRFDDRLTALETKPT